MARVFTLDTAAEDVRKNLARSFQSANINFLIGSGASYPAIPSAGAVEEEIANLFEAGDEDAAYLRLYDFLVTIQAPTNKLIASVADANNATVVGHYAEYLGIIETILSERRTSLLPKQATIFTTNYDLFIEQASLPYSAMRLNDGFSRVPSLTGRAEYSSRTFFTTTSSTGNLYNYKVDLPCINLMKLHGSLSWKRDGDSILFSVTNMPPLPAGKTAAQVKAFVDAYAVVLPQTKKFHEALMDSTYYELLRIYANELDREGTLLVSFGFSFGDSHILGITKRALKNPTLRVVAFAFNDADRETYLKRFDGCNNVDIIAPSNLTNLDFAKFNGVLRDILPAPGRKEEMNVTKLTQDAVLRIGEVAGVDGRRIYVLVDKNKNLSDMFFDGDILRNISVNSHIEIRKGFLSLIGRVEGEKIEEDYLAPTGEEFEPVNRNKRVLTVALAGYIDERGWFTGGTKELPLIGNEAYIVTREKIRRVHNLTRDDGSPAIVIANIEGPDFDIEFPIDGLFNSHIAIFGNTGSGKSNTLAYLYQEFVRVLTARNAAAFSENTRILLLDFNGEYTAPQCISPSKKVYSLSTRENGADKLPMKEDALLDIEVISILADATEKTQKPFLSRAVRLYKKVMGADDGNPEDYVKNILRRRVHDVLQMSDKVRAFLLLDYFREILPTEDADGNPVDIGSDLTWHNTSCEFLIKPNGPFLAQNPNRIPETILYQHIDTFRLDDSLLSKLIAFLYLQLMFDILANRAQNEHVAPVINRLKAKKTDIDKIFDVGNETAFWQSNFVVVSLADVNLEMRKTLPLLLAKKLYTEQKEMGQGRTLSIVIDEAHNILSTQSFREAESWKDYRLETFEEIIKEGRKFGVFVTIASQRPNDISPTITSQAHNYFIHRLLNEWDLKAIASAVSYIDRVTEESIPTLPTGTCIFSGIASQMPLKINVKPLLGNARPQSETRKFSVIVPPPT